MQVMSSRVFSKSHSVAAVEKCGAKTCLVQADSTQVSECTRLFAEAAKELGPRGISVNAIAPGPMDTPFFYGQESEDAVAYHKSASALGGLTDIKDIAPLVRFLVIEGWWITGQTIFSNGGYTTR